MFFTFYFVLFTYSAYAECNVRGIEYGAPVLCGIATQGGLLFGEVPSNVRVYKDDDLVSYRGIFTVGLRYNFPEILTLRFCERRRCNTFTYNIEQRTFPDQHITVSTAFTELAPETVARANAEAARVRAGRDRAATFDATAWMNMAMPADMEGRRITAVYGVRRIINGEPRRRHLGKDFAAPIGTPVGAIADGVVTVAEYMFFNGKAVYIKHGHGISSSYMHLDRIDVRVGDTVYKGQIIGVVGNTGRSTGPHLHLGIYWRQTGLDPSLLVRNEE